MSRSNKISQRDIHDLILESSITRTDWDSAKEEGYLQEIPHYPKEQLEGTKQLLLEMLKQQFWEAKSIHNLFSISEWIREQMEQIQEEQAHWKRPLLEEALQIEEGIDELWKNLAEQLSKRDGVWHKQFSWRLSHIAKELELRTAYRVAVFWRDKEFGVENAVKLLNIQKFKCRQGKEWSSEEVNQLLEEYDKKEDMGVCIK